MPEEIGFKEAIIDLKAKEHFVPFVVILTSGDRYEVRDPDALVLLESMLILARERSDRFDMLRLNQVAAVEVLEPAH